MGIQIGATVFFVKASDFSVISRVVQDYPEIQFVEFRGEHPFFFPGVTPQSDFAFMQDVLKATSLRSTIHTTMYDINLATLNPDLQRANVECYKKYIDLAAYFGSEIVVVHGGILQREFAESPLREKFIQQAESVLQDTLVELANYAGQFGVTIALENSPPKKDYAPVRDAESHIRMLERIGHPGVRALLDIAHAFLRGLDVEDYLTRIRPYLCELHIHNNFGEEDEHLSLSTGKIEYEQLLRHPAFNEVPVIMEIKSYEEVVESLKWLKGKGFI